MRFQPAAIGHCFEYPYDVYDYRSAHHYYQMLVHRENTEVIYMRDGRRVPSIPRALFNLFYRKHHHTL